MKRLTILGVGLCLVSGIGTDAAGHSRRARCHDVDADFTSELAMESCDSPFMLCASGTIKHDHLLRGSMFVTINDMAESAGMMKSEPPWVLSVSGERTLTPHRGGSLSAHVVGIFDTAQGVYADSTFDEINVITGGTGRFHGATGTLHVFGWGTSSSTFAGEIQGRVCVP